MEQSSTAKMVLSWKLNGAFSFRPKPVLGCVQEQVDMVGSVTCMTWFM